MVQKPSKKYTKLLLPKIFKNAWKLPSICHVVATMVNVVVVMLASKVVLLRSNNAPTSVVDLLLLLLVKNHLHLLLLLMVGLMSSEQANHLATIVLTNKVEKSNLVLKVVVRWVLVPKVGTLAVAQKAIDQLLVLILPMHFLHLLPPLLSLHHHMHCTPATLMSLMMIWRDWLMMKSKPKQLPFSKSCLLALRLKRPSIAQMICSSCSTIMKARKANYWQLM
mmetsp:Transcript_20720/g.30807  ORF Transcript_20720/g.30807 Transcript_20720/m.30807 type:complete len:222 (-) Transcript_20720:1018-1683(-)